MIHVVLILFIGSFVKSDWVEIPQAAVPLEKETEKLDFTSYMLTTTSTTLQTPILPKPTVNKKYHTPSSVVNTVNVSNNNATIIYVSTKPSPIPQSSKNITNIFKNASINTLSNNTDYKKEDDATEANSNEDYDDDDDYDESEEPDVEKQEAGGGYTYANFIPYMSSIQSVLMKSAHKSKKSKVSVLTNLKNHLLGELDHRMNTLWRSPNREAREYKEDSHVDFPSNEGALMTIGFLTFGVFLIKLVLQLIQAINNKMNNGDNGTTTTTIIGRKRRSAVNEESVKILNYIEQYRFK